MTTMKGKYTPSTIDIVFTAALSVVIGGIFVFWSNVMWDLIKVTFGLMAEPLIYGMWFIGATIPAYILRKPGIALLGELLSGFAELIYGSQFFATVMLYSFGQGIMSEIVFLIAKYKRWGWGTMSLAGAAPALFAIPADFFLYGVGVVLNFTQRLIFWSFYFISGALLAGVLIKAIIDEVAKTGVLDAFPVGREIRKKVKR